ncbi:MAG: VTT domain-containing protein [Actinomycetota bacterium]|nr:VTT domain-containing protein [Actinomycetota bacterium]MDQ3574659.1 VTT domain-containing protein [Actinomycetota bacterium]
MDPVTSDQRPTPRRRTLVLLVVPILAVIVVGNVGNLFHAPLLKEHPLWLAAMEPRNRYLLLVAGKVSFWPFLLVATARRLVSDPLFYLLGHLYGDRSVRWMERKMGEGGAVVRGIERTFKKAGPLMVFLFPGMPVCILAGATGMSPVVFLTANVVGTVTVVTLLYQLAEVLDGPLGAINRFYGNNTLTLFIITAVLMAYWLWDQRRRGRSELQPLSQIERELEGDRGDRGAAEELAAVEDRERGDRPGSAGRPEHG